MDVNLPELIFDGRHDLAEGPVWHEESLWWVNITAGELHRLNPVTGRHEHRHVGGTMGCAVPVADGHWLVARDLELHWLDWKSGAVKKFCALELEPRHNRFNDGQCDPSGRLWIGTMDRNAADATGSLYVIELNQPPRRVLAGLTISNGMAWSADGTLFYFTDTITRRIDVFDFDVAHGTILNRRPLAVFNDNEFPDGMTLDADDNLWAALWGAGCVVCLDGRTGRELRRISLPVSQPSSCVFGGARLEELFITTARSGLSATALEHEPRAGGIFRVRPGVCGRAARGFNSGGVKE
jgi:sugar lactone lactonase YvrE